MPWISLSATEGEPVDLTLDLLKGQSKDRHDGETTTVITAERRPENEDVIYDWAAVAQLDDGEWIGVECYQATHPRIMPLIRVSRHDTEGAA